MNGKGPKGKPEVEGVAFQRLDMWLWCARVAKARSDCVRLVEEGALRLNRQPTVKPHAKLRVGDVLTMALRGEVRVWRVAALATRRGPAPEARGLYEEVPENAVPEADDETLGPCAKDRRAAYEGPDEAPDSGNRQAGFQTPLRRIERDGPES